MLVSKWGNSLAVRLPAALVKELGLKEGDDLQVRIDGDGVAVQRAETPEEILQRLEKFRGLLKPGDRMTREEMNAR